MIENGFVVDVETTANSKLGFAATPYSPSNELVLAGSLELDQTTLRFTRPPCATFDGRLFGGRPVKFVVGHNLAFDLPWLDKANLLPRDLWKDISIWDTQLAEYLITGQVAKMTSLDDLSAKYGGTKKDERVSALFKSGVGADKVDKDLLGAYLREDLRNTRLVFEKQVEKAVELGMLPLVMSQMDARLATIEMEYNGMAIAYPALCTATTHLQGTAAALKSKLNTDINDDLRHFVSGTPDVDITKPAHLSAVLYGGTVKKEESVDDGFYKNGKPRTRKVLTVYNIPPLFVVDDETKKRLSTSREGVYETSESALLELKDTTKVVKPRRFIEDVLQLRHYEKQLSTYYTRICELAGVDGILHGTLNHAVTNTGRLSSSSPNLQNITNGEIKKYFISRWGEAGRIVELDYAQLEMAVLAAVSGDKQLLADIAGGVDMHTELYKEMYGRVPTKEERKHFKRCSFALVYGAGAGGIAEQSGMTKQDAKKFISTFYARYPGVSLFHSDMQDAVEKLREYEGHKNADGTPVGISRWQSPLSNRMYVFKEYENDTSWAGKQVGFSTQEIKNYPIQGGATGDIVPLMVGVLFRALKNNPALRDNALLINTVHDSILLDVHVDALAKVLNQVPEILEDARKYIDKTFPWQKWPIDLKVGVSYGNNWLDQVEWRKTK